MSSKPVVRLPKLRTLRVKSTAADKTGPCTAVMTNLLNCWASNAEGAAVCAGMEQELKLCMVQKHNKPTKSKTTINYHAARLFDKVNPKSHD